ncbi:hypothetical protein LCGC14_1879680 [marine sediment metagenome]|uniref:HNH domain-containing protein n=1 Tax=marine sediment metagenome TaxID=412755 RepID=A0A0F9G2P7_9ZZZZ
MKRLSAKQNRRNRSEYNKRYRRTLIGQFKQYKDNAKTRGHEFDLSFDEFQEIVTSWCYYCGEDPPVGVDRFDNAFGYRYDNVVPCCANCNYMKRHRTTDDFIAHVKRIAELWKEA